MPAPTRAQLLLIEIGAAAAALGLAGGSFWIPVGVAVGAVFVLVALLPFDRRWLYQALGAWTALRARRRGARRAGLPGLIGGYEVVPVADPRADRPLAAIRWGTTWSVPLEISLDDLFNEDRPVPVAALTSLLDVEDVPLASVRVLTAFLPSTPRPGAPPAPVPPPPRLAERHLIITLDAVKAADPIAARGGSDAAVAQILRRCALRAAELLDSSGLEVRPLDEAAAETLLGIVLGVDPGAPAGATESWRVLHTPGGYSTAFAVDDRTPGARDAASALCSTVPARLVVDSLVLEQDDTGTTVSRYVRVMAAERVADNVRTAAQRLGLRLRRSGGEQADLLRATSALGWAP
jgi:type VII secretion protein EccE